MKTKVLFAIVAVVCSFAAMSCGNKKAADAAVGTDSCCVVPTEQVCDSVRMCCQADSTAVCPKADCPRANCEQANCPQTDCPKAACKGAKCGKACPKK